MVSEFLVYMPVPLAASVPHLSENTVDLLEKWWDDIFHLSFSIMKCISCLKISASLSFSKKTNDRRNQNVP